MTNIVDKYLNKKKKDLLEYSKLLYELIEFSGKEEIFENISSFSELAKASINNYVDKYFYYLVEDFSAYDDYLGSLKKCDNKFKTVLVSTIDSIEDELSNKNNKIPVYIVSLIIYISVMLNRFTYPYIKYKINVKNISTIIDIITKDVSFVNVNQDADIKKELTSQYLV